MNWTASFASPLAGGAGSEIAVLAHVHEHAPAAERREGVQHANPSVQLPHHPARRLPIHEHARWRTATLRSVIAEQS